MHDLFADLWLVWVGIAVAFALLEILLPHFGLIFASGAALAAALVSARSGNWAIQLTTFAVSLLFGLFLLRPRLIQKIQSSQNIPSRTERLIGKQAHVIETIEPVSGKGRVEVDGQDWAAQGQTLIPVGTTVTVEDADGIVLKVKKG